jgi:hypothetical protein
LIPIRQRNTFLSGMFTAEKPILHLRTDCVGRGLRYMVCFCFQPSRICCRFGCYPWTQLDGRSKQLKIIILRLTAAHPLYRWSTTPPFKPKLSI